MIIQINKLTSHLTIQATKKFNVKVDRETNSTIHVRVNREICDYLNNCGYGEHIIFDKETKNAKNLWKWAYKQKKSLFIKDIIKNNHKYEQFIIPDEQDINNLYQYSAKIIKK